MGSEPANVERVGRTSLARPKYQARRFFLVQLTAEKIGNLTYPVDAQSPAYHVCYRYMHRYMNTSVL